MNINENLSIEHYEIMGDMMEDAQQSEILEAVADEQELTSHDHDDWYQQLIDEALLQEEREIWANFWNDKENE